MRGAGLVLLVLWVTPAILGPVGTSTKNSSVDHGLKVIHKLDEEECVPRLICEMAASAKITPLSREETSILAIFRPLLYSSEEEMASPLRTYRVAAAAGSAADADAASCVKLFTRCPLTGHQLRMAFKAINTPKFNK